MDHEDESSGMGGIELTKNDILDGKIDLEGSPPPIQMISNGTTTNEESLLIQTLKNKTMWICSLFIFVYVGAEVSMGGWVVTFMRESRNGGTDAGYIVTGFWGGITLGRAVLPALNVWVGEKRIIPYYIVAGVALEVSYDKFSRSKFF